MLDRFERKLEGAVGDAFARLFRSEVVPQEIEAALKRAATDGIQKLDGGYLLAPNNFVVTIGASDHERLTNDRELTERVFARHLAEYITEQGWQTYAAVRVHFDMSDELHTGQFRARGTVDPDVAPQSGAVWPVARTGQPDQAKHSADAHPQPAPELEENQQSGAASMTPQRDAVRSIGRHLFGSRRGRSHEETGYPAAYRSGSRGRATSEPQGESTYYDPDYGEPVYDDLDFASEKADPAEAPVPPAPPIHRRTTQWSHHALTAVLELGDGSGRSLTLRRGATVIGRGQDAQFRVPDTGVSRRHAEIRWDGQLALLSDLKSTNGTTVNGSPITVWQLADGDVIRVGHSEIIVRIN
ncbi:DUF3662 and FHA domain-containing protein [Hoyosella sp. YIM 151337]|nr:DUF3662 and FHA domain-containing protein [Hoyosella sp. YIM 151337]MCW4354762.1 DUF3662 and FHA domain-containing protein [Hoyosella sp. YIM 151337]